MQCAHLLRGLSTIVHREKEPLELRVLVLDASDDIK